MRENFNSGWSATLDGHQLSPIRLDGWQQGFVVPAGGAGTVELSYRANRAYRLILIVGAALALGLLALGLAPSRRFAAEALAPAGRPGRLLRASTVAGATIALALVSWPAVAAFAVLVLVGRRRPALLAPVAGLALVAAAALVALDVSPVPAEQRGRLRRPRADPRRDGDRSRARGARPARAVGVVREAVVTASLPRGASAAELAVLHHPDRHTSWIVVLCARLAKPPPDLQALCRRRLAEVAERSPILSARWRAGEWHKGSPAEPMAIDADPLRSPALLEPFDLAAEPPVRLLIGTGEWHLALAAHHAALDGRGMTAVLGALIGEPTGAAAGPAPLSGRAGPAGAGSALCGSVRRLLRPADRVAPSPRASPREAFAARDVSLAGPGVTAAIAEACVAAAGRHNARLGWPWRRIGLSLAIGGPPTVANVASYRRLDLDPRDDVRARAQATLASAVVPPEQRSAPRALRALAPLSERFSDSLLISNLGRCELAGAQRMALFPVARGRSAVAFGASSVARGRSTISLRARDLDQTEADRLIDDVARHLEARQQIADRSPPPGRSARHALELQP